MVHFRCCMQAMAVMIAMSFRVIVFRTTHSTLTYIGRNRCPISRHPHRRHSDCDFVVDIEVKVSRMPHVQITVCFETEFYIDDIEVDEDGTATYSIM